MKNIILSLVFFVFSTSLKGNEEGEATFKQLKKYGKVRVLHPLNPKYEDIELSKNMEYRIVGVVLEKKKRYR